MRRCAAAGGVLSLGLQPSRSCYGIARGRANGGLPVIAGLALWVAAGPEEPLAALGISTVGGNSGLSMPMQIVVLLTLLTLLPAAVMCVTPFLRITIVLHFLRQALGTQSTPS